MVAIIAHEAHDFVAKFKLPAFGDTSADREVRYFLPIPAFPAFVNSIF